jgi:hypothetical protein
VSPAADDVKDISTMAEMIKSNWRSFLPLVLTAVVIGSAVVFAFS